MILYQPQRVPQGGQRLKGKQTFSNLTPPDALTGLSLTRLFSLPKPVTLLKARPKLEVSQTTSLGKKCSLRGEKRICGTARWGRSGRTRAGYDFRRLVLKLKYILSTCEQFRVTGFCDLQMYKNIWFHTISLYSFSKW